MLSESVPARHLPAMLRNAWRAGRSRLPASTSQWQAGSGEAGGNAPKVSVIKRSRILAYNV